IPLSVGNNIINVIVTAANGTTKAYSVNINRASASGCGSSDNIPPTITSKNVTVYLDATGHATIQPSDVIQSVTDNCGVNNSSFTVSPNSFTCANAGTGGGGGTGTNHQAYVSNTSTGNQFFVGELGLEFRVNAPGGI